MDMGLVSNLVPYPSVTNQAYCPPKIKTLICVALSQELRVRIHTKIFYSTLLLDLLYQAYRVNESSVLVDYQYPFPVLAPE
jgi:hypothetical protein